MSNQQKKEERKKAREAEQQKKEQQEATRNQITKVLTIVAALTGILIFFKWRPYIGYYLAAIAIPYGAYGMFLPYKSAREYAKNGYAMVYSRQFGTLMISLGVLGIFYSRLIPDIAENKWFLIALLVYLVLFFVVLSLLQKRYMKQPEADENAPTLEEMANMIRVAKKESKESKKENNQP